jgi:Stealth protein CR1, conserved region 1
VQPSATSIEGGVLVTKIASRDAVRPLQGIVDPIIVTRNGTIVRFESSLTPHEAQIEDLVFLRKALANADIPVLLIRDHKSRPILAVDIQLRPRVERALAAACVAEPMYAKTLDGPKLPPVLVGGGRLSELADPRIVRLYRRRIARGGFRYGPEFGVDLQFWVFEDTVISCPVENSLTRKELLRKEATPTTVKLYGYKWQTIKGMFTPHASDVTFYIDLVFSWVDGSDPQFRARRAAQMSQHMLGEGDDAEARIRQIDELKYPWEKVAGRPSVARGRRDR